MLVEMLEQAGMPGVVAAPATPDNVGQVLGEVLAGALRAHRQAGGRSAAAQATDAPAAAEAEADLPVAFVEELPPVTSVVPEDVWQPGSGLDTSELASRSGSDFVRAEYSELPPQPETGVQANAAAPHVAAAAAPSVLGQDTVPLDIIDSIAAGAGSGADPQLDDMEGDELLAAARAALGLDQAALQQLVDNAAAEAAAAMSVPFVASNGSRDGSRKPWEAQTVDEGGPTAQPSSSPARQAKDKAGGKARARKRKGARKASGSVTPAAANEQQRAAAVEGAPPGTAGITPKATEVPVESFILSKSQLKEVTEKHGLDFQELMRGLSERGIPLSD